MSDVPAKISPNIFSKSKERIITFNTFWRDDLLDLILQHKMAVSQAINKIKTKEKLARSKKPGAKDEDLGEEDESEGEQREEDESNEDEYDFIGEWKKAKEEEKEKQLTL